MPTVIDRAWDQESSFGGLSCPHEMNRHARAHGFNWKRLFPTMRTCLICKSKSKTLFVKQSVVIRQNLMSCYRRWKPASRVTTYDTQSKNNDASRLQRESLNNRHPVTALYRRSHIDPGRAPPSPKEPLGGATRLSLSATD